MPSERVQRQIDRLLDEAESAIAARDWDLVAARAEAVLRLDGGNADALAYLAAATKDSAAQPAGSGVTPAAPALPASFVAGRYEVLSQLGEGGRKVVYRARDTVLKREVAFALIKTEGLDEAGRVRVRREAELLAQLGTHPNVVTIFELGEDDGRPYLVSEFLAGGDLVTLIEGAPDHRLALARVLELAVAVTKGLAYAHTHGVVHRDLKPANVWLTDDGIPKLGDFGLALSDADPRLTQAGMIAGTALYMAPEQATGGEVTARSDLYSLGCLFYELVTGRPPFVGDESVAIIGQHLHANPVAPSWHRPDCPPALEALVLRLLEKDPRKRPAAAAEVAEALAGISLSIRRTTSESRRQAQARGPSPVYQRAFVGREQELRQLEGAFDAAVSGQGGLVLVMGEPGIGKTTLTEQLATYASLRGGQTLVGHCYEEGSLSLPYLPFVEALRSYVLTCDPNRLRSELGTAAPEVARIVSEVRGRVQVEPAPARGEAGEDRYRLLQGISTFLHSAALVQPLVLVLEDLHDADRGTLELLTFLVRQLGDARLLVVGTYRDVEVDRQHPLSATLAELRRGSSLQRVLLRGLTADEVQRMIGAIAGQDVTWALAETVHRQTEGNPLFVQEVVRYIAEAGLVHRQAGRWQATSAESLLTSIPEGLRDVIGRRLSRLSPECNRILSIAAVIGREFSLTTLQAVGSEPEETVAALLDEAVKVAVLQDQTRVGAVRYRFAHTFFRQTLYDELSAPRRLRLHQQIARALEQQYASRLGEHAAELADHFAQSTDATDLGKAVSYGQVAAQRALDVFAYGEAARLLRQAREVQAVLDPDDDPVQCDLLLDLMSAAMLSGEPLRAAEELGPQAYRHAERLGDADRAVRACRIAWLCLAFGGAFSTVNADAYHQWADRAAAWATPGTLSQVWVDLIRADAHFFGLEYDKAWTCAERALELASDLDDRHTQLRAVANMLAKSFDIAHVQRQFELANEFSRRTWVTVPGESVALLYRGAARVFFQFGARDAADALWQQATEVYRGMRNPFTEAWEAGDASYRAFLDGSLADAVSAADHFERLEVEGGAPAVGTFMSVYFAWRPLLHLGRFTEALGLEGLTPMYVPVSLACIGDAERARKELLANPLAQAVLAGETDVSAQAVILLLEAAILLDEREIAASLADCLRPLADLASAALPDCVVARQLGAAAALLGERDRAMAYSKQAVEVATRVRFRPEVALTRLQLGELLLVADATGQTIAADRVDGREHLSFAIGEFEAMGMQPALARAQRLHATETASEAPLTGATPDVSPAESKASAHAAQVFISYAGDDRPKALALAATLEAQNISVWLDRRNIAAGSSWDAAIVDGIKQSAIVAVFVSPKAVASDNVRQELRLAMQYRKPILPLLLAPTVFPGEVEYVLAGRQWIEVLDDAEEVWFPRVLAAVQRLAEA